MTSYRRLRVPGGTYFFTVAAEQKGSTLLTDEIDLLRIVYRSVLREMPFRTDAIVVLPDHLHAVWTLPEGDADFSGRWQRIKALFSRHAAAKGQVRPSLARKGEKGLWQRRFWEHRLRDAAELAQSVALCHRDPVTHGLVTQADLWPYSSLHRQPAPPLQAA
jgi:putative transposase